MTQCKVTLLYKIYTTSKPSGNNKERKWRMQDALAQYLGNIGILRLSALFHLDTFSAPRQISHQLKCLASYNNKFKQSQKPLSLTALPFTIFENKLLFFTFWYIFRRENIYSRAQLILRRSKRRFIFNFQFENIWYSEKEPLLEDSIAFFNKYNRVSHKLKLVKLTQQKLSRKATMELPKTRKRHNN